MKFTTEYDQASGICIVRVTGKHKRPEDSMVLQKLARDLGIERNYLRFLFDMRQANIVGGTMDIYNTGTVPADTDHKQTRQMIALAYSGDLTEHEFMETVAVNRGYTLKVFNEIDKAIEWLQSK